MSYPRRFNRDPYEGMVYNPGAGSSAQKKPFERIMIDGKVFYRIGEADFDPTEINIEEIVESISAPPLSKEEKAQLEKDIEHNKAVQKDINSTSTNLSIGSQRVFIDTSGIKVMRTMKSVANSRRRYYNQIIYKIGEMELNPLDNIQETLEDSIGRNLKPEEIKQYRQDKKYNEMMTPLYNRSSGGSSGGSRRKAKSRRRAVHRKRKTYKSHVKK